MSSPLFDQNPAIYKDLPLEPGEDYAFLRHQGLEMLQQLSGRIWTDYNVHDPGITMLEALCYALTDLTNRANQSVPDLLAPDPRQPEAAVSSTFTPPHEAFSNHPVTLADYKALLLDNFRTQLKNVWIEPLEHATPQEQPGQYQVEVVLSKPPMDVLALGQNNRLEAAAQLREAVLADDIRDFLNLHRNLGESFTKVVILKPRQVSISGTIEIEKGFAQEEILAEILWLIDFYLDPYVSPQHLQDQRAAGQRVEDIYAGPLLKSYLLQETAFRARHQQVHLASILKRLLKLPGVRGTSGLMLRLDQGPATGVVLLEADEFPVLDARVSLADLVVNYQGMGLDFDRQRVFRLFKERERLADNRLRSRLPEEQLHFAPPLGDYLNLSHYESIQTAFPAIYGLGEEGPPSNSSLLAQAQALQLKGYLLLFEQIMANFCAQVDHAKDLLSADSQRTTYFSQPLHTVPRWDLLLGDVPASSHEILHDATSYQRRREQQSPTTADTRYQRTLRRSLREQPDEFLERRNAFLVHLLARFGYSISPYQPLLSQARAINQYAIRTREQLLRYLSAATYHRGAARFEVTLPGLAEAHETSGLEFFLYLLTGVEYVELKIARQLTLAQLEARVHLSARGTGPEPAAQLLVQGDVPDFAAFLRLMQQARTTAPTRLTPTSVHLALGGKTVALSLRRKLPRVARVGVVQWVQRYFQNLDEQLERFYLLDHVLLRPADDTDAPATGKPEPGFFQYQATLVLPSFTRRFSLKTEAKDHRSTYSYREYFQHLVQQNAPAHLLVNVLWLSYEELRAWETLYLEFRAALQRHNSAARVQPQQQLTAFLRRHLAAHTY
ncbi:hypothetical protein [Hymenobacter cellulosivorans]|uniref:Lantibiotic dehydratase N-terminal domain-containing protein n=1 Tax=Hymenobacter cellulosivorans TaxID=2932249 RepID=A0ABY4F6J6_9BACT|nr:hypothetical protein [Hymenobacter cellulosivorans]UOQ52084.1 hypothetical protein MUN80_20265 [Hymenobacter cellulosivorans]